LGHVPIWELPGGVDGDRRNLASSNPGHLKRLRRTPRADKTVRRAASNGALHAQSAVIAKVPASIWVHIAMGCPGRRCRNEQSGLAKAWQKSGSVCPPPPAYPCRQPLVYGVHCQLIALALCSSRINYNIAAIAVLRHP